jgi:hypothetical protein
MNRKSISIGRGESENSVAQRELLGNLNTAETVLRANLHLHELDETVREHMERALNHVREGYIAVNEIGKARSVRRLVSDLDKVDRLLENVRKRQQPGVALKPIRV